MNRSLIALMMSMSTLSVGAGCAGRPSLIPNADKSLQRTAAEFAADAAKRHPYKVDAERGGQALARAEVDYILDKLKLVNLSDSEWTDAEVWVNGTHVVFLPRIEPKTIKSIDFQMLYNDSGSSFPTSNGGMFKREPVIINKVELFRDGQLYNVPVANAE